MRLIAASRAWRKRRSARRASRLPPPSTPTVPSRLARRLIMSVDLTLVWAGLLAFAVFAYIVMDGFDLGVGILFPTLKAGDQRDKAMNSIAPVWDGNETWLILGDR